MIFRQIFAKLTSAMNSVVDFLEISAKKYPNKIFLKTDSEEITYFDFLNKVKRISLCFSLYKNKPIVVYVTNPIRTLELFFAVLYSGNYYVPIDIANPDERKKQILSSVYLNMDKRIVVGFDNEYFVEEYDESFDNVKRKTLQIKDVLTKEDEQNIDAKVQNINLLDPCYIVYTSGSTGVPKGVIKSHLAIKSFAETFSQTFDIKPSDVFGNQTPLYFDASAKDIYLALKNSATIAFIAKEKFSFPVKLVEYLNDNKVSIISWVPSALSIVAQFNTFKVAKPKTLKKVMFVGEVMPIKYLNYWFENVKARYFNLYGSSETAGIICYYEIKNKLPETSKLPIGKSLRNAEILIINDDGELAKPNEIGEIYVRGPMLASGYFNSKELTDKVFVQNPLNSSFLDTVYKSGDMGYRDDDGNIVFAARRDFQIKHMGHRIELTDIEIATSTISVIKECCAVYNQNAKRIVLYYSLNQQLDSASAYIKKELMEKLPDYMIPNKYVCVEDLPKLPNGKIDRKKLNMEINTNG